MSEEKNIEPVEDEASGAPDACGASIHDEDDVIDVLKKERDEYLEGWRRAKADYENLLKEMHRSKDEYVKYANEQALLRLLPAIDQFEVALNFTPSLDVISAEHRRVFENWIVGLEAVRSLWLEAASELGLDKLRAVGPFDPKIHEAVGEEASNDIPQGDIVRTTANGWKLNGKVIRAAKVVVSKKTAEARND